MKPICTYEPKFIGGKCTY